MNRRKILFLAANPEGKGGRLRLDKEKEEIREGLRRSQSRDLFDLQERWAVNPTTLRRAVMEENPHIIHFCGHGSGENGIVLEGEDGNASYLANGHALGVLFDSSEDPDSKLECVFLNACYSEQQANIVTQYVDYVIGMNNTISDASAIEFATAFYDALGARKTIERAYAIGCVSLKLKSMPGESVPVLRRKPVFSQARLSINQKIKDFVGRDYVFKKIASFISSNSNGYFEIIGDPGMGKSSILAKYVQDTDCIAHFNVQAQCQTAEDFLKTISIELIRRYRLASRQLPAESKRYASFLVELLEEASQKRDGKPIVIAIDALDEVEEENRKTGFNILYFPVYLPEGIYIVMTRRQGVVLPFITHSPKQLLNLMDYPAESRADVCVYIQDRINKNDELKKNQRRDPNFLDKVADKSQNNFMYLVYVLNDVAQGIFSDLSLDNFPKGLQEYYEFHWKRMGMTTKPLPMIKIYTVYQLAESHQPISLKLISEYIDKSILEVSEVLCDWQQFLHSQNIEEETCYSIYHASFRDFLHCNERVKAAGISLKEINKQKSDFLWEKMYGDQ